MKTLIKGGTLVNEGRLFDGSIVVEDSRIAKIIEGNHTPDASYDEVIDASGCFVLPGIIDDHVHFREPGLTAKADMDTESQAAAAGGVTTYFDMPNTVPQTTTLDALEEKYALGAEKSHVNYAFFFGATNDNVALFFRVLSFSWVVRREICLLIVRKPLIRYLPLLICRSWYIARIRVSLIAIWLLQRRSMEMTRT